MNTLLEDTIVLKMWDIIYPDIVLDEEERKDTALKLIYLVSLALRHHSEKCLTYYISRVEIF